MVHTNCKRTRPAWLNRRSFLTSFLLSFWHIPAAGLLVGSPCMHLATSLQNKGSLCPLPFPLLIPHSYFQLCGQLCQSNPFAFVFPFVMEPQALSEPVSILYRLRWPLFPNNLITFVASMWWRNITTSTLNKKKLVKTWPELQIIYLHSCYPILAHLYFIFDESLRRSDVASVLIGDLCVSRWVALVFSFQLVFSFWGSKNICN